MNNNYWYILGIIKYEISGACFVFHRTYANHKHATNVFNRAQYNSYLKGFEPQLIKNEEEYLNRLAELDMALLLIK